MLVPNFYKYKLNPQNFLPKTTHLGEISPNLVTLFEMIGRKIEIKLAKCQFGHKVVG